MNHPKVKEAMQKALDELLAMSPEEFKAMLDEQLLRTPTCMPDTCGGECQGMGWCYRCEAFRGELPDEAMEDLMA